MTPKRKETSIDIRNLIIEHYKSGFSEKKIAEIVQRSRTTVHYIIQKFKDGKSVENAPRTGRRCKLTGANERWVVREVKKNPKINAATLAKNVENSLGIDITPQTIRNVLRKNDYHARSARRKPYISKKNRKARLEFALSHVNKPADYWMNVIFADESKFNLFGCDGKTIVYRKPNTELEERNMVATIKHGGGGVMVWGCMTSLGVGNLVFVDGNLDHRGYIDILKENLGAAANKFGFGNDYKFYQDNDPKHCAHNTRLWLLYNCPNIIKTPAQSPDLNPIEHVWATLEKNIRKCEFSSKTQLKAILQQEWQKIDQIYLKKLVESMPNRLRAVIKRKGKVTKY